MILSALGMILNPNAVNSAMCMIVTLVATAGLFVLLEAYFLAILQVLVYAGAVMVLFLFIIMLLDVDKENETSIKRSPLFFATLLSFLLLIILAFNTFMGASLPLVELSPLAESYNHTKGIVFSSDAKSFGYLLFTKYMLPFQIIGFLLLVAMVGVIVISKSRRVAIRGSAWKTV